MRCIVVARDILAIAVAILGVEFSSTTSIAQGLPVTIQIHDYAHVPGAVLSHASATVSRIYERIGVRIDWVGVAHPGERRGGSRRDKTQPSSVAQMTIVILTPKMAARAGVAEGVLGYAAVPEEGMGRIAFAIHERVRTAARQVPTNEAELLGFVMAHEIGHLLLPAGSGSDTGPMQNHWNTRELRGFDPLRLEFSAEQALQIRSTIENASPRAGIATSVETTRGAND
jgi:hypothetical protein